jgi:FMN reductase
MSVLFLSGSPSLRPSRSSALLDHAASRLILAGIELHRVSLWDFPAEDLIAVRQQGDAAAAFRQAVGASDAIVVSTPVYNASIPGGLKAVLDLLAERSLAGKTVLPLASGGSVGHQLAIEYALKPVLSALGARHVLAGVFACDGDVVMSGEANAFPIFKPELTLRLNAAIDALLALLDRPLAQRRSGDHREAVTGALAGRCSA